MNIDPDKIVEAMIELTNRKGLSMYKLAQRSGISQTTLSNLLKRGNLPSLYTLIRICDGLEIRLSEFFIMLEESECNLDILRDYYLLTAKQRLFVRKMIYLLLDTESH